MSQQLIQRPIELPYAIRNDADIVFGSATVVDATGEEVHYVGQVWLENPIGGAKTISSAGGKIHWRSGAVTFANAGTTFDIGIQDVSTITAPAQGDGTFDVSASLVGGTDVLSANSYQITAMETGSKALSHGQIVSIAFKATSIGGVDSIVMSTVPNTYSIGRANLPATSLKTAGTFVGQAGRVPIAGIEFDDGTVGWIHLGENISDLSTVAINVDTATADEYGNFIQLPVPMMLHGIGSVISLAGTTTDFEMLLYSDPLGSPVALATAVIDATQLGSSTSIASCSALFSAPVLLQKDTPYAITIRPTTTNNVTLRTIDYGDTKFNKTNGLGNGCYAIRRLNNAGAFSDYNGGTAKTRLIQMWGLFYRLANDDGLGAGGTGGMTYIQS